MTYRPDLDPGSIALDAIKLRDVSRLEKVLENGLDPNAKPPRKYGSFLHAAIMGGHDDAVEALLQAGGQPRALSHRHLDSSCFDRPELEVLANRSGLLDRAVAWESFTKRFSGVTASSPQEADKGEDDRPITWTPLAVLMSGVPEYPVLVPKGQESISNEALRKRQLETRQIFDSMSTRPGRWSPDAIQEVFCGAVCSAHASVLPELEDMGLFIEDVPRPTEVLNQLLILMSVYPKATLEGDALLARSEGWFHRLVRTSARWDESKVGANSLDELASFRRQFIQMQMDHVFPPPVDRKPAPRM